MRDRDAAPEISAGDFELDKIATLIRDAIEDDGHRF